ncbi:helix-turn-helix transcriptional regulator [Janibacter terrae]|uniref:helix-turn-helix domain-containing transcriptional regulator n=1 Tax=Janibacter TaxID=53457 RepID=UPI0009ED69D9|nr:helix-turn-helix transcriptional regulator [Janibacter terrae]
MSSAFWDDLSRDLEDPEFRQAYIAESVRIATIDSVVNALDEAREAESLSKAELARALHTEPATMRRLFTSGGANPTLGTLAEVAAAVGMRITVEPMSEEERAVVTKPLRDKRFTATKRFAREIHRIRATSLKHTVGR